MITLPPPPREELAALAAAGMSRRALSARYGVSYTTIDRWLMVYKLGTTAPGGRPRKQPPEEELRTRLEAGEGFRELAERYGCTPRTVRNWMSAIGGVKRPKGSPRLPRLPKPTKRIDDDDVDLPLSSPQPPTHEAIAMANPFGGLWV